MNPVKGLKDSKSRRITHINRRDYIKKEDYYSSTGISYMKYLICNENEMNPKVEKFHLVQKSIRNSSLFFPLMCGHFLL